MLPDEQDGLKKQTPVFELSIIPKNFILSIEI